MRRRNIGTDLTRAHHALDLGNTVQAIRILEDTTERQNAPAERASLLIELAAAYLLAGDEYLDLAAAALDVAANDWPASQTEPLTKSLQAELSALYGEGSQKVRSLVRSVRDSADCRACFHAASALLLVDQPEAALRLLRRAQESADLPRHLEWRSWSLTGVALEQLGDFKLAARSIRQAVAGAPEGESQELERLALADCLLELGDAQSAATELAVMDLSHLPREEDHVYRSWLQARAELDLGNPGLAIQHYRQARERLTGDSFIPPGAPWDEYGLLLAEAQLLADKGAYTEALDLYRLAVKAADAEQLSLTRHELAVVLIEADDTESALQELTAVARDENYQWRAEVIAEMADLAYRNGDNTQAERLANEALALRPVPAAYLCLGSIAFEYFRLDEAVSWFELAASESMDGEPAWVAAQQLLADAYAQMGPESADRLYLHAQLALKYTDQRNDWYLPLRSHAESAQRALAGQRRLVN